MANKEKVCRNDEQEKEICEVVDRAKEGDEEAYNFLLSFVQPDIKKLQSKLWVFGYEEDDIFNECGITLLDAIANFDPSRCKKFRIYVRHLFRRRIVSLIQRSKRHKNVTLNISASLDCQVYEDDEGNMYSLYDLIPSNDELLSERIERREYCDALKAKMYRDLTKKEREVFELYLEDLSYEEIASKLSIDAKSVDNAIQRVKNKIPRVMKDEISEHEKQLCYRLQSVKDVV